jgi:phosphate transport system protein
MDLVALPPVDLAAVIPGMADVALEMVRRSLQAFIAGSASAAQQVLEMDDTVDQMNREIFLAMDRMMRESPEYSRQALDALLIGRNLERVADHATNIAEDVIFWQRGADVRHHGFGDGGIS